MKKHFNAISKLYYDMIDTVWCDNKYYHQQELAYVLQVFSHLQGTPLRILDAGCGPGRHAVALAKQGHQVTALDFAENMLIEVQSKTQKTGVHNIINLVQADARSLPFHDKSFDGIICVEVLEHLPNHLSGARLVLKEFDRVLKDDGILVVEVPLKSHECLRTSHPYFRASWKDVHPEVWQRYQEAPLTEWHHFEEGELSEILDSCAFSIEGMKYIRVIPAGLIERYPMLESLDRYLEEHPAAQHLSREMILLAKKRGAYTGKLLTAVDQLGGFRSQTVVIKGEAAELEEGLTQLAEVLAKHEQVQQELRAQLVEKEQQRKEVEQRFGETLRSLEEGQRFLTEQLAERERLEQELRAQLVEKEQQRKEVEQRFKEYSEDKELYIAVLGEELRKIRAWSLYRMLSFVRQQIARAKRLFVRLFLKVLAKCLPVTIKAFYRELRSPLYINENNSQVKIYRDEFKLNLSALTVLPFKGRERHVQVSLVVTVRNEGQTAKAWLNAIAQQSRLPDELIIVDGGSTDGTLQVLREAAQAAPINLKIIEAKGVNIAKGKNIGIQHAKYPVIVHTDFGCDIDNPQWLEKLMAPFEMDPNVEVVAGWYEPLSNTALGKVGALRLVPTLDRIDPQSFLPSTRSIAFKKEAWRKVGGYPEWLTLTGDDTYFALELKRLCPHWAFVPEAKVKWHAPNTLKTILQKVYRWSVGDGEAGLFPERYWDLLRSALKVGGSLLVGSLVLLFSLFFKTWLGSLVALVVLIFALSGIGSAARRYKYQNKRLLILSALVTPLIQFARVIGFIQGVRNRHTIMDRRHGTVAGVLFILSGVPITDSGGGQRAAQLALTFLDQNYVVVFVNKFPSYENVNLNISNGHPLLFTYSLNTFDLDAFLRRYPTLKGKPKLTIIEFPLAEFVDLAQDIRAAGGKVIYDCIDDWTTSLGSNWYSQEVERRLIASSDMLIATAEPLRERLEEISGCPVALVPNAVNTHIFRRDVDYPRPPDLPGGEFVICYVGALWGEWFDWDLLRKIALAYPKVSVAVIGDYRGQCPDPPFNLHFLGLKPQTALPAYLAHSDVAIIPWRSMPITHATNPLKVYEYLAMHKPVVAPSLKSLQNIPYVLSSRDHDEFIVNIERARNLRVNEEDFDNFIQQNSWEQRISTLIELVNQQNLHTRNSL